MKSLPLKNIRIKKEGGGYDTHIPYLERGYRFDRLERGQKVKDIDIIFAGHKVYKEKVRNASKF